MWQNKEGVCNSNLGPLVNYMLLAVFEDCNIFLCKEEIVILQYMKEESVTKITIFYRYRTSLRSARRDSECYVMLYCLCLSF